MRRPDEWDKQGMFLPRLFYVPTWTESITVVLTFNAEAGRVVGDGFVMEKENKEFSYYVRFGYNGKNYSFLLTSHSELEKEKSARCLIDTVEFGVRDYLAAENLLVEGKVLQNVCLYDKNGKFIVCTSDLAYE